MFKKSERENKMSYRLISVETVPHDMQRYDTVGDWQFEPDYSLTVNVSKMNDKRHETLVAIHEIIEAVLCKNNGIRQEMVDEWDKSHANDVDPGSIIGSPYYREHLIATMVERMIAHELEVNWNDYEEELEKL